VQKQLDILKIIVNKRIYILFMKMYNGNKSLFAKSVGCDEKTIRLIFDHNQGMTLNLFIKIAFALNVDPSDLLKDIRLEKQQEKK
jgi:hypothetical protein